MLRTSLVDIVHTIVAWIPMTGATGQIFRRPVRVETLSLCLCPTETCRATVSPPLLPHTNPNLTFTLSLKLYPTSSLSLNSQPNPHPISHRASYSSPHRNLQHTSLPNPHQTENPSMCRLTTEPACGTPHHSVPLLSHL